MSTRLTTGGRLIDRSTPLAFTFNGKRLTGFAGDTLASALLANGQMLLGRSFKYHRPRSVVGSGAEEPNALLTMGTGPRCEPNQRATTTQLFAGASLHSQNHWPSLEFDVGALNTALARFLPAGFYYKMFMHPRALWKHLYEPVIRQSAGLGPAPQQPDPDLYEHIYHHTDLLVIGGGVAGILAALQAAQAGQQVTLIEQAPHWGGRAPVDGGQIAGQAPAAWISDQIKTLAAMPNVTLRSCCMGAGVYDHGYVLAYERFDHDPGAALRHRLWKIRARQIITATGAIERPLSFAGNDVPGVVLASAVRDYLVNHGVSLGDRVVIVTNNDDAYRTALAVLDAGLSVPVVLDARPDPQETPLVAAVRARGVEIRRGMGVAQVKGGKAVTGVDVCLQAGEGAVLDHIPCDVVAMSGGWSPVVHLWSHCGGKLVWDAGIDGFRPDATRPPTGADGQPMVQAVGAANGAGHLTAALADAAAAFDTPPPDSTAPEEGPLAPVRMMPQGAAHKLRAKAWLDFQNDVKVSDVQLAAQEGFESVEHTKRYTTLGMATDQGKLSNINGLSVLSDALHKPIPEVGTTTFRPPYTPISMGAIAGEARGDLFQPVRQTPLHEWHAQHGATWEPVGQWRRPYAYPRAGEATRDAVAREVTATRTGVGMLDASTLGKLLIKGPDAGRLLDMLYTNMMSTLKPGRCRYGLMCNENGFLVDDGVVARLTDDSFLCHTTSGGAEAVHAAIEDWLQTEWWDWQVYTANLTEQFGQIAVVGPKSRAVLQTLTQTDLGAEAFPFMTWIDADLAGVPVRIYRISFSGELSYEIAAPANRTADLWAAIHAAGAPHGITPYGTEALHIMRAEKGFIMIGDETDGTVIPQDLGLDWAISKKKADYLGKRAQQRRHMTDPDRWKLVGLETLDGSTLPDGAYAVAKGENANGQQRTQGRVTSTYHSPTLDRGIAMGLVHKGPERMGEVIEFATTDGRLIPARIVSPVFYDPAGEKQNV